MIVRCGKCGRIKQRRHNCERDERRAESRAPRAAMLFDTKIDEDGYNVSMNTCISHPERNLYSAPCPSCEGTGCMKCGGNGVIEWCPKCREVAENTMRKRSAGYAALNGGQK